MPTSERAYQETLVTTLEVFGWHVCHVYPLQTKHGWRTGTTADGWPDLVCLRREWIIAIEVKSDKGRATPQQRLWLHRFAAVESARAWLLRPSDDYGEIVEWFRDPAHAPRVHGWTPQQRKETA